MKNGKRLLLTVDQNNKNYGIIEFEDNPLILYAGPYLHTPEGPVPLSELNTFYHLSDSEALASLYAMTQLNKEKSFDERQERSGRTEAGE